VRKKELEARIDTALFYAGDLAGYDGDHHKMYCIDQIVRALTGCPIVVKTVTAMNGNEHHHEMQGESPEYLEFRRKNRDWDTGIAPLFF
jgi:hypothetical protein